MSYYEALSAKQEHILQGTTAVSGSLSIIACLFVVWTYVHFKELQVFHLRIILYLTLTDLLCSIVLVIGATTRSWSVSGGDETEPYYALCLVVGALVQFFLLAGILWTLCIAHTLFMVLTIRDYNPERFEIAYHIFCWTIPAVFDVVLIVTASIGDSGIWCWIKGDKGHQIFRYLFLYIPLIVVVVTNIILYIFTFIRLRRDKKQYTPKQPRGLYYADKAQFNSTRNPYNIQRSFGYFTAILVVCWLFPLMNGILHVTDPDTIHFGVYFMNGLLLPLQGFFNALVYGLNDEIREKLKEIALFAKIGNIVERLKSWCTCCCSYCNSSDDDASSSTGDRKKWYDSIMTEYDDRPERRPENEAAAEAILSQGSLYTSAEFDNLFKNYNYNPTIDAEQSESELEFPSLDSL